MVPIGMLCLTINWLILTWFYRKQFATLAMNWHQFTSTKVEVSKSLAIKSVFVFGGLIVAFLIGAPLDITAITGAVILLVWANRPPRIALEAVDWSLLLFFAGLFVVVAGFVKADRCLLNSCIEYLGRDVGLKNVFQISVYTLIGSNLFSNVPFVLIVSHWVNQMNSPKFVWLLLSLTSTFAGNLTLFGSVANIIVAQGAQQNSPLRFSDFLKIGVPITLITTVVGVFLLWTLFVLGWI
jgi:Na+/H+ antiporter NhaD/arsenite permease-like protein